MAAQMSIPEKIALISSFAGYGRCSITEALPVISAMKVQACPVPTAIFSNHTGFSSNYMFDLTGEMPAYLAQWERLALQFDGIYCGFLENKGQIETISAFIRDQKERRKADCHGPGFPGTRPPVVLIDPVMGDHGKLYRTVSPDYCEALKDFLSCADMITPNITEACLLTGTPCQESGWDTEELKKLCIKLHAMGPDKIVITGLRATSADSRDLILNFTSEKDTKNGRLSFHTDRRLSAGPGYHGTGDIFAAILAADAVKGRAFFPSVQKAAAFVSECIQASSALGIPETDGVCLENLLGLLTQEK